MKKLFFLILLSLSLLNVYAKHIKGGFFTYQYEGPGIVNTDDARYKITLTIYMLCDPTYGVGAQITPTIDITIFNGGGTVEIANPTVTITTADTFSIAKTVASPCIKGTDLTGCYYTIVTYVLDNYELPITPDGYILSFQRCCRINNMDNVDNSASIGDTYTIAIPGTSSPVTDAYKNSSPVFPINDTILVCQNNYFEFPFKAVDPDGDSLSYSLCDAYAGGGPNGADATPDPAANPPYSVVPYTAPYSGSQPMGPQVTINPVTGLVSGVAPSLTATGSGEFVIAVCIAEYRNGIHFADSKKELHVRVKDCTPLRAALKPEYITCDGFTNNFSDTADNPTGTEYYWNFGDPASGTADTSSAATPIHTFSDTGLFKIKLRVISEGGFCADSSTSIAKIYPGFFPGFKQSASFCKGVPVQFQDTTRTNYGSVTGWRWDFGNTSIATDTSSKQDPLYTYTTPGTYHVRFQVANTKGCMDTLYADVVIADNPALNVTPHDTIYCGLDTLQLTATGTGSFTWSPSTKINNINIATPLVYPSTTTKYIVTLNKGGCISTDTSTLQPQNNLTAVITSSANQICAEDTLTLTGSTDHTLVGWQWAPVNSLSSPETQVTKAFPATTTKYTLTTTWGNHCVAVAAKTINVIALAVPVIAADVPFCKGEGTEQLMASGGSNYQWTPTTYLTDADIANPVASPPVTTQYTVSAGVTGCTKRKVATVIVGVRPLPALSLTDDTLICSIDTLKLTATGNGSFAWSPDYSISSLTSATPLVSPDVPTEYHTRLTDGFGCYTDDSVFVDVRLFIAVDAGNDTTICQTDSIILHPISDALQYLWSPTVYLNNPSLKNPVATPLSTQTYHVIANLGKCQAQDNITIKVVPYPHANAGNDTSICKGFSVQLQGSGGNIYTWSPGAFLSATNIADPVSISPAGTIAYKLTVMDTLGCPKLSSDTVLIKVFADPVINAGPRDTSVVRGEPLQLIATGGDSYYWSPSTWLSDSSIADPVANPQNNIQYILYGQTTAGCKGIDTIDIKLYDVIPGLYVPSAFTPNGDGINDTFKPILLGMKQLAYFRIYNRYGELVYSTSVIGNGWDGTFKGQPQNTANFVWMAEGIDYKGETIKRQGNVLLIR